MLMLLFILLILSSISSVSSFCISFKMASSTSTWAEISSSELDTRVRFSLGFKKDFLLICLSETYRKEGLFRRTQRSVHSIGSSSSPFPLHITSNCLPTFSSFSLCPVLKSKLLYSMADILKTRLTYAGQPLPKRLHAMCLFLSACHALDWVDQSLRKSRKRRFCNSCVSLNFISFVSNKLSYITIPQNKGK